MNHRGQRALVAPAASVALAPLGWTIALQALRKWQAALSQKNRVRQYEVIGQDGQPRSVQRTPTIASSGDRGNPATVPEISGDVTDQKQAEAKLQRLVTAAIGQWAGGVAHDLDNMLTGTIGYTDLLLAEAGAGAADMPACSSPIMSRSSRDRHRRAQTHMAPRRWVTGPDFPGPVVTVWAIL